MEFPRIKIKDDDVKTFVEVVESRFSKETGVPEAIEKCLKDLQSESPDVRIVYSTVVKLLQKHPDLILSFNYFLPPEMQLGTFYVAEGKSQTQCCEKQLPEDMVTYINKVKTECDANVYISFLKIMKDFCNERVDINYLLTDVAKLFLEHIDLIVGFNLFLPPGSRINLPASVLTKSSVREQVKTPPVLEHRHDIQQTSEASMNFRAQMKKCADIFESSLNAMKDISDEKTT